jgi:hypothetical protein
MSDASWTPAENLPAVALSEANAWKEAVMLCAARVRAGGLGQQTDARLFLLALRLLLRARVLAWKAVKQCAGAERILAEARTQFDDACPGAKDACDVIEHFGEYASGGANLQGGGGVVRPGPAREYWPLDYDPRTGRIRLGPFEVDVTAVCEQAKLLQRSIWQAVRTFEDAGITPPAGSASDHG